MDPTQLPQAGTPVATPAATQPALKERKGNMFSLTQRPPTGCLEADFIS